MGFFSDHKKRLDREELQKKLNSLNRGKSNLDVDLELEDLDVELEDLFDSLGDTFDSLGDTFDSLGGNNEYGGYAGGYTGASKREEQRAKIREELASDREQMKAEMRATKARLREDKAKLKADMKRMKANIKKSLPRGAVNIQSGGSNISVSGNDSISISGTNGNLTMKVGNMRESTFKHKLKLRDNDTDTTTHVRYFDENNFSIFNDEFSGSFNANDASIKNIKRFIRDDIEQHAKSDGTIERIRAIRRAAGMDKESRPPPPKPQMPPNETLDEYNIYSAYVPIISDHAVPNPDVVAPPFDTEGEPPSPNTFSEYDKPHQSAPPHKCEPLFVSRTWKGEKGKPMEFDEGAKVTVAGHNAFGRKYEVKINGNAIYVPEIENLMDYCYAGDHLDAFIEMRSPAEKAILRKIIDGLIAMKIAEPHHEGIKELL